MALGPYRREPYDNRAATRSMADLIARRGDIAAQRELVRGDSAARLWQTAGSAIGNSMADLVRYQADKPRRDAETARATELQREVRDRENQAGLNRMAADGGLDEQGRADLYRQSGYQDEANAISDKDHARQTANLRAVRERITDNATVFGRGAQILEEARKDPALWPELRGLVVDLAASVHPSLAAEVPERYDEGTITGLLQFAATAQGEATKKAADLKRLEMIDDGVKRLEGQRKILGEWLRDARGADDWTANLQLATSAGIDPRVIDQAGSWDESAQARAQAMAGTDDKTTAGSFGDFVQRTERERGRPMTASELQQARTRWEAAGRAPKDDADPGLSSSKRIDIEQWKDRQYAEAEDAFTKATTATPAFANSPGYTPTDEDRARARQVLEQRKGEIERAYRAQMGLPQPSQRSLADVVDVPRQATPPPAYAQMPSPTDAATPSPAAPGAKGTKARADVIARGHQHGMTPEQAIAAAEAAGYTVR